MLFSVDVFFLCENDLKMGQTWDQLHCIIMIIIIIIDEMPFLNAAGLFVHATFAWPCRTPGPMKTHCKK